MTQRNLSLGALMVGGLSVLVGCTPAESDRPAARNGYFLTHKLAGFVCSANPPGSGNLEECTVDISVLLDFPDEDISRIAETEIPYSCEFSVTYLVEGSATAHTATGTGESNFVPWSGAKDVEDYMVAQLAFPDRSTSVRSANLAGYECALK